MTTQDPGAEKATTRVGGRYQLVREIGAGGMGRVFLAVDMETGRSVAAKLLIADNANSLDLLLRFQQEGAVLSSLKHPNIVQVYGTFLEERTSCIVMELLEGRSLAEMLKSGESLPLPRIAKLMRQVADALVYAHSRGIIHRDIKPDNIMVVGDDHVKVTDFGIARVLSSGATLKTALGTSMGTPLYMAPEQIEGQKADARADIYSFGAVLYQLVTGHPPFEGEDPLTIAFQHVHKAPQPPSEVNADVPPDWEALILTALAKNPADRFQTAAQLLQAISALNTESAGTTRVMPALRREPVPEAETPPAEEPPAEPPSTAPVEEPAADVTRMFIRPADATGTSSEAPEGSQGPGPPGRPAVDVTAIIRSTPPTDVESPTRHPGGTRPALGDQLREEPPALREEPPAARVETPPAEKIPPPAAEVKPPVAREQPSAGTVGTTGVLPARVTPVEPAGQKPRRVSPVLIGGIAAAVVVVIVAVILLTRKNPSPVTLPTATVPAVPTSTPGTAPTATSQVPSSSAQVVNHWGSAGSGRSQLKFPGGVAVDESGSVYVADTDNSRIQKFSPSSRRAVQVWGTEGSEIGQFYRPGAIAVDHSGNIYVLDSGNNRVQKLSAQGQHQVAPWGSQGSGSGQFDHPSAITVDQQGNIYVADTGNNRIEELSPQGANLNCWGGQCSALQLSHPSAVAVDAQGDIYVANAGNGSIQEFATGGDPLHDLPAGTLSRPGGIAVDGQGNVYVADTGNNRIVKLVPDPSGHFKVVATTGSSGSAPGQFAQPLNLAVDSQGNVYVADSGNDRVQELSFSQ